MATDVPIEIWRLILREATYVSEVFDTAWVRNPDDRIWDGWVSEDLHMTKMLTKQAIVQVCKDWRDIGVEFLYELLDIPDQPHGNYSGIRILVEAFTSRAQTSSGYGWWARRISLPNRLMSSNYAEDLFRLLEQCHNLEIFTVRWDEEDTAIETQVRVARLLESRFQHSLRRAELFMDAGEGAPGLEGIPQIVGLTSLGVIVQPATPDAAHHLVFKHITTLTIALHSHSIISFPSEWNFPFLRQLSLQSVSSQDINGLIPFVEKHKNTLINLHISPYSSTQPPIHSLLSLTPEVRTLSLRGSSLGAFQQNITFPRLSHLGITPEEDGSFSVDDADLQSILQNGKLPNLQTVSLLNGARASLSINMDLINLIEMCERHGFRFNDHRRRTQVL